RHLVLRHLPGAVVVLLAAHRPARLVDARAGPGHRLHLRRLDDRLRQRGLPVAARQRLELRPLQPAGRALALVGRRQLSTARPGPCRHRAWWGGDTRSPVRYISGHFDHRPIGERARCALRWRFTATWHPPVTAGRASDCWSWPA